MKPFSLVFLAILSFSFCRSQSIPETDYQELSYRLLGPFRGGRTVGAVGIPDQPNLFFIGVNNGGVWKTDDYGRTWNPIFDDAPTGSVGDIAVYPENPDIIYVGSGEGLHRPDLSVGDGIFKTIDGGKNWDLVGLEDIQQVGRIIVHPNNPDIVYVAGLGHPYGPNSERGVYRTKNGGKDWEQLLFVDPSTGAMQIEFDPTNPSILYATMWNHQEGPWENARFSGKKSGLFKSTDGGDNWTKLENGLPTADQGLGRIGIGISTSNPQILYATVDASENAGIYKSLNGGDSWELINTDHRLWGRGGDFGEIKVHPQDPDVLFVGNIASYQSDDGGKTWTSIKGAPGGDDYHRIWINPKHPEIMLFAADQGATLTVNGGKTWSSWYNQPTSQLYHVSTDNQFPYWVYGGQQESGAIGIASRGNGGQLSFREWLGVGADEYAYVAPDPLNPDIIYGGRVMKFNRKTGQAQYVGPEALRSGDYRILRTMPLLFHPADPKTLFFATNALWKTSDGGDSWEVISPDLSSEKPAIPTSVQPFITPEMENMKRRGVIYAVAPSPKDVNTIWVGTDDGLVHITEDGGRNWSNVTPQGVESWDKISIIDASYQDANTCYVAVNAIRKDDMKPYIYRTHNKGKDWELVTSGLPENGPVNVVRTDPLQPGLLFAGTERSVYFSLDDGDNWQSLRLNLPPSSIRDLVIKENDLVIGTHGRSIWILDNMSMLRQLVQAKSTNKPILFDIPKAYRVRWNMYGDTPLPPEEPTGQNPPDGAMIDYFLPSQAEDVKIEIFTNEGILVRQFDINNKASEIDTTSLPHPTYWIGTASNVQNTIGHHRLIWDLRYTPPKGSQRSFSIAAVHKETPSAPNGPYVHPGNYKVRLTVNGAMEEKVIEVALDPRVNISDSEIKIHSEYSMRCYNGYNNAQSIRASLEEKIDQSNSNSEKETLNKLRGEGLPENPFVLYGSIYDTTPEEETVVGLQNKFLFLLQILQDADAKPTKSLISGIEILEQRLETLQKRWESMEK